MLLSLREDYLPDLESLRGRLPSIAENRMRLTRMTGVQALQAVSNPGGKLELVSDSVARQIVRFVAGSRHKEAVSGNGRPEEEDLAGLEVAPSLLSLFCSELNNRRLDQHLTQITADLLAGSSERILQDYYEMCMADQPPAVRAFIEDELLTDSGIRESMALERARKTLAQRGAPASAIDELVTRRLLHVEERLQIQRIELTHDVLTDVIKRSREERQKREAARQAEQREQQVREKLRQSRKRRREAERQKEMAEKQLLDMEWLLIDILYKMKEIIMNEMKTNPKFDNLINILYKQLIKIIHEKQDYLVKQYPENLTVGLFKQFILIEDADQFILIEDADQHQQNEKKKDARDHCKEALLIAENLAVRAKKMNDMKVQWGVMNNYIRIGDILDNLGDKQDALKAYKGGLTLAQEAAKDKSNPEAQRALEVVYKRMGDVLRDLGQANAARDAYEKERALAKDKSNLEAQHSPGLSNRDYYRTYLVTAREAAKDKSQARYQLNQSIICNKGRYQLNQSIIYDELGGIRLALGDKVGKAYEERLALALEAAKDESNLEAQCALAVACTGVGDVLRESGDKQAALGAYEKALTLDLELAKNKSNTQAQEDLAVDYWRMGDMLRELGQAQAARDAYEKVLALELVKDESQARYRLLSITYGRLGNLQLALGDKGAAREAYEKQLALALEAAKDTSNLEAQCALAVAYERMGDVLRELGQAQAARDAYEKELALALELAKDESQARYHLDLSIIYGRLGDVQLALRDKGAAREAYEKRLALSLEAAKDASNVEAQCTGRRLREDGRHAA